MDHDGVKILKVVSRPPRFILDAPPSAAGIAILNGSETRHLRNVMRLGAGAEVTVLAPDGVEYLARVTGFEAGRAELRISSEECRRAHPGLILAVAIIKGPRMDFLVEKAAELGVAELFPVICARGVARAPGNERLERWRRLAAAATKQSLAPARMQVRDPLCVADLVGIAPRDTLPVLCTPKGEPLGALLRRRRPTAITIMIGPEGDFDPAEMDIARAAGFVAARLGPTRLRSETAALAALAIAIGALDELDKGD